MGSHDRALSRAFSPIAKREKPRLLGKGGANTRLPLARLIFEVVFLSGMDITTKTRLSAWWKGLLTKPYGPVCFQVLFFPC